MTAAVAPKLLKTIEEPPAPTIFVVLADDVPPELVTIVSRCVRIDFGPVPAALVEATLVAEAVEEPAAGSPQRQQEATSTALGCSRTTAGSWRGVRPGTTSRGSSTATARPSERSSTNCSG